MKLRKWFNYTAYTWHAQEGSSVMIRLQPWICGVLLFVVVGCSRTESDWKQAKESNSAAAYADFIAKHPNSSHVREARDSMDELGWTATKTKNTLDGYNDYLLHHSDGKHVADARDAIQRLPLRLKISSIAVARKFPAYVGGGANIEAPASINFGGGGGMPFISISNGTGFLAGEVSSKDDKTDLIRLMFEVQNSTETPGSFKIGDVSLAVAGDRTRDFVAVGYVDRVCAMGGPDHEKVREILVQVSPRSRIVLSYVFALTNPTSTQGELNLQNAPPITFEIPVHRVK